jgi:hypothetical protein
LHFEKQSTVPFTAVSVPAQRFSRYDLEVTVTDSAITLRTFLDTIATAETAGRFATGYTGTVAGTAVAILSSITDTVATVTTCLTGWIAGTVTIITVGGTIIVIIDAIVTDVFGSCSASILAEAALRTAYPLTGWIVVAVSLGEKLVTGSSSVTVRIISVSQSVTVIIDTIAASRVTVRTFYARRSRCTGIRFCAA